MTTDVAATAAERLTVALAAVEEAEAEVARLAEMLTNAADAGAADEVLSLRGKHVAAQIRVGEVRESALEAEIQAEQEAAAANQQADEEINNRVIALRRAAAEAAQAAQDAANAQFGYRAGSFDHRRRASRLVFELNQLREANARQRRELGRRLAGLDAGDVVEHRADLSARVDDVSRALNPDLRR